MAVEIIREGPESRKLRLETLVRLRWLAVGGQAATYPLCFGNNDYLLRISDARGGLVQIPQVFSEATAAIAAFLSGPGTLRIQLKPAKPIGAMNLMMSPTKESLGFSATFTPLAK